MSVNVLASTIVLCSVAYLEPTVEVSYVEAEAQVSYIEASCQASWVDVQIFAEVTFPDVLAVEIINPTDQVAKTVVKKFADSYGISVETLTKAVQKVFHEAVTPSDVMTKLLIYQRTFADTFAALDALARGVTKPLSDLVAEVEAIRFATTKKFSDTVGMVDNMDTDIQYLIIKTVSELVYAVDHNIINAVLAKADSVTTGSSGLVMMQDYCDITYFLEDYVGQSRTFT
jgi:hypothetical protein